MCKQQLLGMLEANNSESSTLLEKKNKNKNEEVLSMESENRLLKEKMMHFSKRFMN